MGKSSQTSSTQSSTGPWLPAQPQLQNLLGQIGDTNLGQNPYQPQFQSLAGDLLSGGPDRTGIAQGAIDALNPIASGGQLDVMNNPAYRGYIDQALMDSRNAINSQFASYGRDLSPQHAEALARGSTAAAAPIFAGAYENAANRQLGAIGQQLSGAGLLSNLDSSMFERRGTGVNVANQVYGLPLQEAALKSNLLLPIAGLGSEGQSTTTATTRANPIQVATGGILGGLGLLGGYGGGIGGGFGMIPSYGSGIGGGLGNAFYGLR